ncbi:hypothetical protein COT20_00670 [bacterium (Candidatus Gribaldobacteria) CG08_land_8_20_14_0_20_39_15]|uniref:Uncharacterized protein n=1 Tax=bacterium (Candidatus Gribaldobacteria) CG08_land_8_20_14_0_20_39_15 TaxID=2014273 RepID=A0A2M6XV60_9BACT|nr:MAG: hypothetical protein COT20_00670 [bacterium (Candidatus Gribaldobacteria) CG08_land_8_20_14_0_20_39_15]
MINLLPPQDKQNLKREMIFQKVLAIFSLHFTCLLVLAIILGFLSAFLTSKAEHFQKTALQKTQQLQTAQFQTIKDEAIFLNNALNKLQTFWQRQIPVSVFLERFIPLIPQGLYLRTLSFRLSSKKTNVVQSASATSTNSGQLIFAAVQLEGMIDKREELYEFKKTLERQKNFQDIYFSPSSWAKSQYAEFSLNLSFLP